jgi:hypothetical protein
VREVKEETGCLVRAGNTIGERVHPQSGRRMIYMAAAPVHGTDVSVGDEAELAEVRWVSLPDADQLLPAMFSPVGEYLARELRGSLEESDWWQSGRASTGHPARTLCGRTRDGAAVGQGTAPHGIAAPGAPQPGP